ncbi:MAG: aldehyde dehydrogenase family protein [Limnohabitans sp.]|jgi:acyl-CoA reductase-like NAD-dependent aldehyde dehydrogenase|nr:aldehyde dehydrogenase family protein [Burkholderiales bacterium]
MKLLNVNNPATEELITQLPIDDGAGVAIKAQKARTAQPAWAATPLVQRRACIQTFRALVEKELDDLARTMTLETGKPLAHSRNELNGFLGRIDFFLSQAESVLQTQTVFNQDGMCEQIEHIPLGVIGNISAWNYPWFVGGNVFVPALLMGNAVLYKPSEFAPMTGLAMARLLHAAGVPQDVFAALIGAADTGNALLAQALDGMFFTGSLATGQHIANVMGPRMTKLQLELGGKDPTYVCADADPVTAAQSLADGAMYNAGQSCCSVERVYVHASVHDRFVQALLETVRSFKMGDPLAADTYLGPLTRAPQLQVLEAQVADALAKGARCLLGGQRAVGPFGGRGNWFNATVFDQVDHSMALMREESFGPILGIQKVDDDAQAVRWMNDTAYGLTAGVYTPDEAHARAVLSQVRAGTVYWNCCDRVSPRLPWSGWGHSGMGLTLSREGLATFTRPKAWHLRSV